MIINSITLKNFRSYEDETTFSFTPKGTKNITLIGGENGSGKSTLFEAIKLCIYGYKAYGYLGQNSNYLLKVKNNINNNAFKNDSVNCWIGLNISFLKGTEVKKYYLKRSWSYDNQKINESFEVWLEGVLLNNEDKLYFDKYLTSVVPPSLFDFFFFDGEELSEFFTGKKATSNLKEAILELFNYDTFEILRKQLLVHQRKHLKSNSELEEAQKNYDDLLTLINTLDDDLQNRKTELSISYENLETLIIKKNSLEEDFRNSGGLLHSERMSLNHSIDKLENERTNINQGIKDFCNNTLPFLMVPNILKDIKNQINKEDSLNTYNSLKNKLSGEILKKSFSKFNIENNNCGDFYSDVADTIISNMFAKDDIENISSILQFSSEQKNSVLANINDILTNESSYKTKILNSFTRLSEISVELKKLKTKLKSTVSEDILNTYLNDLNDINNSINQVQNSIVLIESDIEKITLEIQNKKYHLVRAKNELSSLLQKSNIVNMSVDIVAYLDKLLNKLIKNKISLIEDEFIKIFSNIIRKNNYVNSIVIDDSFDSTLYINKYYNTSEIINIINNIGFNGLTKKYGPKFVEDLYHYYNVSNNKDLEKKLFNDVLSSINLSTKVNISDFSSGEKQIYILCLIWAIIKSSGIEIPFIIDTPYARIDETHRNALSNMYLPNISKQTIILSTNKEIDSSLYKVIKPYICDEYLLIYDTNSRKTEVKNGYFEV